MLKRIAPMLFLRFMLILPVILTVTLMTALLGTTAVFAQENPPDVINAALADLNQQTGAALTLESPELQWSWAQETYPDASLGCPQPDQMYAQVVTEGYLFLFTYRGQTYDYRAPVDGQMAILCSSYPAQTLPLAEATADPLAANPAENAAENAAAMTLISTTTAGQVTQVAAIQGEFVAPLAWLPGGNTVAVASLPGARDTEGSSVLLFDVNALDAEPTVIEVGEPISALSTYVADQGTFLVAGGQTGGVSLFPVDPASLDMMLMQTEEGAQTINSVAITPDGTMIASASGSPFAPEGVSDNSIRLWNAQTGALGNTIEATGPVGAVAISPDGARLAYGTGDGTVQLVNTADGGNEVTLSGQTDLVRDLAFSPDGQWLASGSMDGTAYLWNLATDPAAAQPIVLDTQTDDAVLAVAFSPDGIVLATAGGNPNGANVDNAIRLWDPATGALLTTLPGHTATVAGLAFSPDGTRIASVGDDMTLRVWGIAGSQEAVG